MIHVNDICIHIVTLGVLEKNLTLNLQLQKLVHGDGTLVKMHQFS